MPDLGALLAQFCDDPNDANLANAVAAALHAHLRLARTIASHDWPELAQARQRLVAQHNPERAVGLLDAELSALATSTAEGTTARRGQLLIEKAQLLDEELLDATSAQVSFGAAESLGAAGGVVQIAQDAVAELNEARANWSKFVAKYEGEAATATDRALATSLYFSAAAALLKYAPADAEHGARALALLEKSVAADPKHERAWLQLRRLHARAQRGREVIDVLQRQADHIEARDALARLLVDLATALAAHDPSDANAERAARRALTVHPGNRAAVRWLSADLTAKGDWAGLSELLYQALRERRALDDAAHVDFLEQLALLNWHRLGDLEKAEEAFRRIRRVVPAHALALEFYRQYYGVGADSGKLIALLRQAERALLDNAVGGDSGRVRALSLEIAERSEAQLGNPEKAIDAWKQLLRTDPQSQEARAALYRLYQRTEKWNALLDLYKEDIERLPADAIGAKVDRYFEMIEIYRDRLRLDVMVLSTYGAILKLAPENERAEAELAERYRVLARWNDLIALLTQKAERESLLLGERCALLFEVADLWIERFGNYGNAIRPLERITELDPEPAVFDQAIARLKDIFVRRRQWRGLIDLLGKERARQTGLAAWTKHAEMARLAAERVGDNRLALELNNQLLALVAPLDDADAARVHDETLVALAALYERERRYPAQIEILERQAQRATLVGDAKIALALQEKIAALWSDRLNAPAQAAAVWRQVLSLEPAHQKALRVLRDLYVAASDYQGMERLYRELGQDDELPEALLNLADRQEDAAQKLFLVERAADFAQARQATRLDGGERAAKIWERVLALEPNSVRAASALLPHYEKHEKWSRLLAVYEVLLRTTTDTSAKLALLDRIAQLCEVRIGSKAAALNWQLQAFALAPVPGRRMELLRLASDAGQLREVATAMARELLQGRVAAVDELATWRDVATTWQRVPDAAQAKAAWAKLLTLAPGDEGAEQEYERALQADGDWPALIGHWQQLRARTPARAGALTLAIATCYEERLGDIEQALATYQEAAVDAHPDEIRRKALAARERIHLARSEWPALLAVLAAQEPLEARAEGRATLRLRMAEIHRDHLHQPGLAYPYYRSVLDLVGAGPTQRAGLAACTAYLAAPLAESLEARTLTELATLLVEPPYVDSTVPSDVARALEILRADPQHAALCQQYDQRLLDLYHQDLGDPAAAWAPALRLLNEAPEDRTVRTTFFLLAGQLGRDGEATQALRAAAEQLEQRDAHAAALPEIWAELAQTTHDRLADHAQEEAAWRHVLRFAPEDERAHLALAALYRAQGNVPRLRESLAEHAKRALDDATRLATWREIAALCETDPVDVAGATHAWAQIREIAIGDEPAFAALARYYESAESWPALVALLADQAAIYGEVHRTVDRARLLARQAELTFDKLGQGLLASDLASDLVGTTREAAALALLERIAASDANREATLSALATLIPVYEEHKQWPEVLRTLQREFRLVHEGPHALPPMVANAHVRIGEVAEQYLSDYRTAYAAYDAALGLEPWRDEVRVALRRVAIAGDQLERYLEVLVRLDGALAHAGIAGPRVDINRELAELCETRNDDAQAAAAHHRVLQLDGDNTEVALPAHLALARIAERQQQWPTLVTQLQHAVRLQPDGGKRRALMERVAHLQEHQCSDPAAAVTTWRDVLTDFPEPSVFAALDRLLTAQQRWPEVVDNARAMLDADPTAPGWDETLMRVARLQETEMRAPVDAVATLRELVERDPRHGQALAQLVRLYESQGQYPELLDTLQAQLAAGLGDPLSLHVAMATLQGRELHHPHGALDEWTKVLELAPAHPEARAAVTTLLDDVDLRDRAFAVLAALYTRNNERAALAALTLRSVDWSAQPETRSEILENVVLLHETCDDKPAAFAVAQRWLQEAASTTYAARAVATAERLADQVSANAVLIDCYVAILPDVVDLDLARRLHLDVADLSRALRQDAATAATHYRAVLDHHPDDRRALAALESVYRDTAAQTELADILVRQAQLPNTDADEMVAAMFEAAELRRAAGRTDDAIDLLAQVADVAPAQHEALTVLIELYSQAGRWHDVIDLYERRAGFATDVAQVVEYRLRIGQICEERTFDLPMAIESYGAALSDDPTGRADAALRRLLQNPDARNDAALELEPYYVAHHRWAELVEVYTARVDAAPDSENRIRAMASLARLYEEQLEDFDAAASMYARLFAEQPDDESIRDHLHRLASVTGQWDFALAAYGEFLDRTSEQSELVREIAVAKGVIHDRRRNEVVPALAAYRRGLEIPAVLGAEPTDRDLLARVEEVHREHKLFAELVAVYSFLAERPDGELRRYALEQRASVTQNDLQDPDGAIAAWREVMGDIPDAGTSVEASLMWNRAADQLDRLFRQRERWADLIELLESRLVRAESPAQTSELRLALAQIHIDQQHRDAAIDQYEQVLIERVGWERAVGSLERLVVDKSVQERVIELLEPVYRREQWWQKLVVILDAKRAYVFDDFDKIKLLQEIADLHIANQGDFALARTALVDAWRIDVSEPDSLARLFDATAKSRAWSATIADVQAGIATSDDPSVRAELWRQLAVVQEREARDATAAIASWQRAQQDAPDDPHVLSALDRLLAAANRYPELVDVVWRRAELAEDPSVKAVLLHRAGAYAEEQLKDDARAIAAYREVTIVDLADLTAYEALGRLYTRTAAWQDVADTLERKLELASRDSDLRMWHAQAAQVYETQLDAPDQAIAHWQAVVASEPKHVEALEALSRLFRKIAAWPELVDVLDQRALYQSDSAARAQLAFEAGRVVESELRDLDAAVSRYGGVLQLQAQHQEAKAALFAIAQGDDFAEPALAILERHCRAVSDVPGLVTVYTRKVALAEDADAAERKSLWGQLADTHEILANDAAAAMTVWAEAITAMPEDVELLGPLARLAASSKRWREFAQVLDGLLAKSLPGEVEQRYAMEIGGVFETELGDRSAAERAYRRAAQAAEPAVALSALERMYARDNTWDKLVEVLAEQAHAAATDAARAEFLYRRADLLETVLQQPMQAVRVYQEVLDCAPSHVATRDALMRMLQQPGPQRAACVALLEPLWESAGAAAQLVVVLRAKLEGLAAHTPDHRATLERLVALYREELGDLASALDCALQLHQHALGEPDVIEEIEQLSTRTGAWAHTADTLAAQLASALAPPAVLAMAQAPTAASPAAVGRAPTQGVGGASARAATQSGRARTASEAPVALVPAVAPDAQVRVASFVGQIYAERLGRLDEAARAFELGFAADAHALSIIDPLVAVHRRRNDAAGLVRMLMARAQVAEDAQAERAAYFEAADTADVMGDGATAIAAWRAVLARDAYDRDALARLAAAYSANGQRDELRAVLEQSIRAHAGEGGEAPLRRRLAGMLLEAGDRAGAKQQWQALIDADPADVRALQTLEQLYAADDDWHTVRELKRRRADAAVLPAERIAVLAELAEGEAARGQLDDAIATWYAAQEIDRNSPVVLAGLDQALRQGARWHDVVELWEGQAELAAALGDEKRELAAMATVADLWEGPLDNPDACAEVLEKMLHREPNSVPALLRLAANYARNQDFAQGEATLARVAALGVYGVEAAQLHVRTAQMIGLRDASATAEIDAALQAALRADPTHVPALEMVLARAEQRHDVATQIRCWQQLAETKTGSDMRRARRTLGGLLVSHGQPAEGVLQLLQARGESENRTDQADLELAIADAYVAAGNFGAAEPIYAALAELARVQKRPKDMARYRERQAALLARQGQTAAAIAAYEEAFKAQPTDVATMLGLGQLYRQAENWEGARRIYQSLVLQSIDPAIATQFGATKPALYLALGDVYAAQGQTAKAQAMYQRGLEFDAQHPELKAALARTK